MSGLGPLTFLDLGLIAIVALSALVAMYRGLTREVLSILSWVAALAALLYFIRYHRGLAEELAKRFADPVQAFHVIVLQVALGGIIFLIVLIIVHLITSRISDGVLDSRIGAIDRILGLGFGVLRGFVLVLIPYMFAVSFLCKDGTTTPLLQGCRPGELPIWVEKAQFLPIISQSGGTLYSILTRYAPTSVPSFEKQEG
jgi:membrane protein required for colicin V production